MIKSLVKGLFGLAVFLLPALIYEINQGRGTHYAAIAISKDTMQFGAIDHQDSRRKANEAALDLCKKERKNGVLPQDCKIGVWFFDACGALAIDPHDGDKNDGAWGADWAGTQKVAEKKAMENCERHSRHGKCKLVKSFCSM